MRADYGYIVWYVILDTSGDWDKEMADTVTVRANSERAALRVAGASIAERNPQCYPTWIEGIARDPQGMWPTTRVVMVKR